MLGDLGVDPNTAQDGVKKAAEDRGAAEQTAETHLDEQAKLLALERAFDDARAEVARTRDRIRSVTPRIGELSLDALGAKEALDDAVLAGRPVGDLQQEADAAHAALVAAQQQLTDAHASLDVQRAEVVARHAAVVAQQQVVAEAEATDAPAVDPVVAANNELAGLTVFAMMSAGPLMQSVGGALAANPEAYAHGEAAMHLLAASIVLHTQTDEVASLMRQFGVENVAQAFRNQFNRPMIEDAQLAAFDLDTEAGRAAFESWAHQLWGAIESNPELTADPARLAEVVFNHDHDHGYDQATELARPPAPPTEAGAVAKADDDLVGLTMFAMMTADPLIHEVESRLRAEPHGAAGVHLLAASVVLHNRTADVVTLIQEHGVEAVAQAFNQQFESLIFADALVEAIDVDTDAGRAAFETWAHQQWVAIESDPRFAEHPVQVAVEFFHRPPSVSDPSHSTESGAPLLDPVDPAPNVAGSQAPTMPPKRELEAEPDSSNERARHDSEDVVPDQGRPAEAGTGPSGVREEISKPFAWLPHDQPMPVPSNAGPQKNEKVPAAHGMAASHHVTDTLRHLRHVHNDVLNRPTQPPTTPNGLYAAVAQTLRGDAATLRQHVVRRAAGDPVVTKAVADFTAGRPMHPGHLYGALVENLNWRMRPEAAENAGAGNARDLVGHLIATQLNVDLVIRQGPGEPVVLRPMGGQSSGSVEIELVMVNGEVTYRAVV